MRHWARTRARQRCLPAPTGTLSDLGGRFLQNVLLKGWPGSIDHWTHRQPRMRKMRSRKRWRCCPCASRASSAPGVTVPCSAKVTAGGARRACSRTRTTSSTRTSSDNQGALHPGGGALRPSLGRGEDGWYFLGCYAVLRGLGSSYFSCWFASNWSRLDFRTLSVRALFWQAPVQCLSAWIAETWILLGRHEKMLPCPVHHLKLVTRNVQVCTGDASLRAVC